MAAQQNPGVRKEAARTKRETARQRRQQVVQAFIAQRREDKALLPLMIGAVVTAGGVGFGLGVIWGLQWTLLAVGLAAGVLAAVIIFSRRLQRNVYRKAEGQPGAAGWALENMRGQWRVTAGVATTTQLDTVHRVIGRPGVVLVAEGAPHRAKNLLAQEKKRVSRLVGQIPIYNVVVGNEEGQVPLRRLQAHLAKLPRNISAAEMDKLETRLAALTSRSGPVLPKGPLPQGARMRSVQRAVRRR